MLKNDNMKNLGKNVSVRCENKMNGIVLLNKGKPSLARRFFGFREMTKVEVLTTLRHHKKKKKSHKKMKQPPQILPQSNISTKLQKIHCSQKNKSAAEKNDCCILLYTSIHQCVLFIQVRL